MTVYFSLVWSGGLAAAAVTEETMPFKPGEKMVYSLYWGVIPAGQAELEILPFTEINGVKSWHFCLSVRTTKFLDVFYKVRDRIEAFAELDLTDSLLYKKNQHEGGSRRDVEVKFDQLAMTATYRNKGEVNVPISIMPGTIDPLTAVFFVRNQPLETFQEIQRPITDGKKNVVGNVAILKRETIHVDGIDYDTFLVEPDLREVSGVFEQDRKSNILLWITADERRLLVKIKSKVIIGSFTGTLINPQTIVDAGADDSPAAAQAGQDDELVENHSR